MVWDRGGIFAVKGRRRNIPVREIEENDLN
jgi:hypothetical protein